MPSFADPPRAEAPYPPQVYRMRRTFQLLGYCNSPKTYRLRDGSWVLTAWNSDNSHQARIVIRVEESLTEQLRRGREFRAFHRSRVMRALARLRVLARMQGNFRSTMRV